MTVYRGPGGGGDAATDSQVASLASYSNLAAAAAAQAAASAATAAAVAGLGVYSGSVPPSDPAKFPFWWDKSAGIFYLYVSDGTSTQWVGITGSAYTPLPPAPPAPAPSPPAPAPAPFSTSIPAESGTLAGGATTSTEVPGYEGTSHLQWFTTGSETATYTITGVPSTGAYDLKIRYFTWGSTPQENTVKVNSGAATRYTFNSGGSWGVTTIPVSLNAGTNTIQLAAWSGYTYFDTITVSAQASAPAPSPAPSGSTLADGFPKRVLATYFEAYASTAGTTFKITNVPTDFNVIYLFNARFNSDGSAYFPFMNSPITAADVQTCRARGQKVILTLGGADLQFIFTNRTQTTNFVNSIQTIITALGGVDGIDWNNFEGGALTSSNLSTFTAETIWATQQLRNVYGTTFASTAPVGGNTADTTQLQWATSMNNAGCLTWVNPQYYDWSGYKSPGFVSNYQPAAGTYGYDLNSQWVNAMGGDASKVVMGFSANYWGYNLPNGGRHTSYAQALTLAECTREFDAATTKWPNQRGAFCWNAYLNSASVNQYGDPSSDGNNLWGSTMKARLNALG